MVLVTEIPAEPEYFKRQLIIHEELVHITVEVNYTSNGIELRLST